MARYRLEALQRGKRPGRHTLCARQYCRCKHRSSLYALIFPAYLFVEWDEEVDGGAKEHSIVEGKATALTTGSNSFIPGGRVLCKLPEGDFPATILCAGACESGVNCCRYSLMVYTLQVVGQSALRLKWRWRQL